MEFLKSETRLSASLRKPDPNTQPVKKIAHISVLPFNIHCYHCDEYEASQRHGRQRVNDVDACCVGVEGAGGGMTNMKPAYTMADKGLMMWLLLCQGWSRQAKG